MTSKYSMSSRLEESSARLACDMSATAGASLAISPIVAVVDRFLTSTATKLLFAVYFGTYTTANTLDSILDVAGPQLGDSVSPTIVKLLGISAVSTGLTVYKDSRFAQMFGTASSSPDSQLALGTKHRSPPRSVPPSSYLLFTLRDVLTIYGCFVLPPLLAETLGDLPAGVKAQLAMFLHSFEARARSAQLILPVLVQFVSTPIHLLGLDLYNRQSTLGASARLRRVGRDLSAAVPTRMLRILPAFGVGGVLNSEIRTAMLRHLRQASSTHV